MRPQQQNRRMRGRNNNNNGGNNNNNNSNNRRGPNPLTRNYESNGPDVKIRGSAQQIAEKYTTLARDSHSSGDRVMAENYLQHAEHYNRIIAAAQAQMPIQNMQSARNDMDDDYDEDRDDFDVTSAFPGDGTSPNSGASPNNQGQQNQGRNNQGPGSQGQNDRSQQGQPNQGQPNQGQPNQGASNHGQYSPGLGPQPMIEGFPAEVALNQQPAAEGNSGRNRDRDGNRDRNRDRGRPRDYDREGSGEGSGRDVSGREAGGREGSGRDMTGRDDGRDSGANYANGGREGGASYANGGYQAPAVAELVAEASRAEMSSAADEAPADPVGDGERPRRGRRPRRRDTRPERDLLAGGESGPAQDGDGEGDSGGPGLVPVES